MIKRKNGRPKNAEAGSTLEVTGTEQKLLDYLDELQKMQGFGNSRSAIARGFIWKEVNRLIEARRLKER